MSIKKPNYTQVSNDFIEALPELSGAAVKVFLAISRKTIGFHKDCEILSQLKLAERTGLSRNSVKNGAAELITGNFIRCWSKGSGKNTRTFYELDFSQNSALEDGDNESLVSKTDIEGDSNGSKIDPLAGSNGSKIDPLNGSNGSKIDPFINKRNLKEIILKKFGIRPSESKTDSKKKIGMSTAIEIWNEFAASSEFIPRYRYTSVNVSKPSEILKVLGAFTAVELCEAIANYLEICGSGEFKAFPEYTGFEGFMIGGVEKYISEARPFDRCRISGEAGGGETMEERLNRLGLA